jgi:phage/plasmid-like protein (TIGR03299 family)
MTTEKIRSYNLAPWQAGSTKVEGIIRADEAIANAGLDWEIETVPVYHQWGSKKIEIPGKTAMRRNTDGKILSILTPKYVPVQNRDAFRFFDSVVDAGAATYELVGSSHDGQRIWILAKMKDSLSIKGDEVKKYLMLLNGHDGTLALKMFFTPIRVWCENMIQAAEASARRVETFYAKHTGDIGTRVEQAREIIGLSNVHFETFRTGAERLALKQLPAAEMPKLLAAAFGTTGAVRAEDVVNINDLGSTRRINEMEKVTALFDGEGTGLDGKDIRGTMWAAYNAIVEYCDYGKQFRGDAADDNRLDYTLMYGNQVKARAWKYLQNL